MAIIIDDTAGTLTITDTAITFPYGSNPAVTRVASIVITPAGGVSTLPIAIEGASGPGAQIRNITLHEVAPGDSLPGTNPAVTIVTPPGDPGVMAVYDWDLYLHRGDDGSSAPVAIFTATDIAGTATAKYMLVVNNTSDGFTYAPQKVGGLYVPTSISSTAPGTNSPRILCSLAIPSYPFDWWPSISAEVEVTGAGDTQVDLVARLNNSTSGDQVGYGRGVVGATVPPVTINGAGYGSVLTGGYGKVSAGSGATVHLVAVQVAPSGNNWLTGAASLTVRVNPVP